MTDHDLGRPPLVEMRNIRVAFGGVHAVDDVTVDLYPGEVVGLVGGNGAGKTTLMRALSGAHKADSGEILVDGEPATINNPRDAKALGIETIYQTLGPRGQHRRRRQHVPRARDHHAIGQPRQRRDGGRHAQGHGPAQPQVHQLRVAGAVALGWPAAVGRHRPGDPLQRPRS